jgi:hypothetical protein
MEFFFGGGSYYFLVLWDFMSIQQARKFVLEMETHLDLRMFSSKYNIYNRQLVLQQLQVQFQLRIIGT